MSDFENYYDYYSDGFASRHGSGDDASRHSDSDVASRQDAEAEGSKTDAPLVPFDAVKQYCEDATCVLAEKQSDAHVFLANVLDEKVDPWATISQLDDIEAFFAEYWHLLTACLVSLRSGSVEFISAMIVRFLLLVKEGVPFCPDHHLVGMGGMLETLDLLCNCLPRIKARNIRRDLQVLQRSLDVSKSDTVDYLLEQVASQKALIEQLQRSLTDQQGTIDQQQVSISSLQSQLESSSIASPSPSFSSSLSEHSSLQKYSFTVRDGVNTKEQRWDGEGRGQSLPKLESGRLCGGKCGKFVAKSGFTSSQWRKAHDGVGKCRACSVSVASASSTPVISFM